MVGTQNNTATSPANGSQRSDKTRAYREHFKPVLTKLNVSEMSFYPKMLFTRSKQLCLALYKSELEKTEGFYTMVVNSSFDPQDGEYKLYYLKHNPKYATDYLLIETDKWAVPYDLFDEIDTQLIMLNGLNNQSNKTMALFDQTNTDQTDIDSPFSEMTVRDFAAITWRVPVSEKEWLNQMIKEFDNY